MKVIGIKFKDGGKVYYFAPNESENNEEGMQVVVETSKSTEFAYVAFLPKEVDDAEVVQPLKPILRIATDRDREQVRRNAERKPQAMKIAQEKIEKHGLKMKLIDCEFAFDGKKVVFYFAAEGRVDFRELVKDLASTFRIRIELRQVGIRDETRLLGGLGPCGRECCCAGALPEFRKVSIKMAKVQGLSLNPGKISGLCGRLMCCLSYENDYYAEASKKMPKVGSEVATPEGRGTVVSDNMLKMTVRVKIEKDGALVYRDFSVDDIRFKSKKEEPHAEGDEEDVLPPELAEDAPAPEQRERPHKERAPREGRRGKEEARKEGRRSRREKGEQKGEREGRDRADKERPQGERPPRGEAEPRERQGRRGKGRRNREERGEQRERQDRPAREHKERSGGKEGAGEARPPQNERPAPQGE